MEGETKEGIKAEHISIKVQGSDGAEIHFKIKRHTPLRKLMEAYCERQGKDMSSVRFHLDGTRLRPEQTPAELDMEDGDTIDANIEQTGGAFL